MPDITITAISALYKAWAVTTITVALFVAALALSQVWDTGVYVQALRDALALAV